MEDACVVETYRRRSPLAGRAGDLERDARFEAEHLAVPLDRPFQITDRDADMMKRNLYR